MVHLQAMGTRPRRRGLAAALPASAPATRYLHPSAHLLAILQQAAPKVPDVGRHGRAACSDARARQAPPLCLEQHVCEPVQEVLEPAPIRRVDQHRPPAPCGCLPGRQRLQEAVRSACARGAAVGIDPIPVTGGASVPAAPTTPHLALCMPGVPRCQMGGCCWHTGGRREAHTEAARCRANQDPLAAPLHVAPLQPPTNLISSPERHVVQHRILAPLACEVGPTRPQHKAFQQKV